MLRKTAPISHSFQASPTNFKPPRSRYWQRKPCCRLSDYISPIATYSDRSWPGPPAWTWPDASQGRLPWLPHLACPDCLALASLPHQPDHWERLSQSVTSHAKAEGIFLPYQHFLVYESVIVMLKSWLCYPSKKNSPTQTQDSDSTMCNLAVALTTSWFSFGIKLLRWEPSDQ